MQVKCCKCDRHIQGSKTRRTSKVLSFTSLSWPERMDLADRNPRLFVSETSRAYMRIIERTRLHTCVCVCVCVCARACVKRSALKPPAAHFHKHTGIALEPLIFRHTGIALEPHRHCIGATQVSHWSRTASFLVPPPDAILQWGHWLAATGKERISNYLVTR